MADSTTCTHRSWAAPLWTNRFLRSATRMPDTPETSSDLSHAGSAWPHSSQHRGPQSSEEHPPLLSVPHLHLTQQYILSLLPPLPSGPTAAFALSPMSTVPNMTVSLPATFSMKPFPATLRSPHHPRPCPAFSSSDWHLFCLSVALCSHHLNERQEAVSLR